MQQRVCCHLPTGCWQVTFQANGMIANMEIDGRIQMKSYLSGDPDLVVGLNQDLAIGKAGNCEQPPSSLIMCHSCCVRAAFCP